jgi:flagellar protein FliL
MAKEEPEEKKEGEGKKGGKKKLIIIAAVVLVILIGGGLGAFFAFSGSKKAAKESAEGEEGAAAGDEEEVPAEGEAAELPGKIEPLEPFIVNLQMKGSFLKTSVNLEFGSPEVPRTMANDLPKIRDAVIRVLSSKSSQDLLANEGKEKLRTELKDAINQIFGSEEVVNVYFTDFIIQ